MKLLISKDWLLRKIASDRDIDIEAGRSLSAVGQKSDAAVIAEQKVVQLRTALGVLVRKLRLRDQLSIAELAYRTEVSEEELRCVEHDPHFTAGPRLIFRLSNYFNVSLENLSQMAGLKQAVERSLYNEAIRYAARSDDMSTLNEEERRDLDAFVAILNKRGKD